LGIDSSAGAKVSQFDAIVLNENILGLYVAMKDASSVHVVDGLDGLVHVELHTIFL
jgi:hypothetical protein